MDDINKSVSRKDEEYWCNAFERELKQNTYLWKYFTEKENDLRKEIAELRNERKELISYKAKYLRILRDHENIKKEDLIKLLLEEIKNI